MNDRTTQAIGRTHIANIAALGQPVKIKMIDYGPGLLGRPTLREIDRAIAADDARITKALKDSGLDWNPKPTCETHVIVGDHDPEPRQR